jgi:hypothetical protein
MWPLSSRELLDTTTVLCCGLKGVQRVASEPPRAPGYYNCVVLWPKLGSAVCSLVVTVSLYNWEDL